MVSRQRVLASLNHIHTGKVPFDLGGTSVSTLYVGMVEALNKHYGIDSGPVTIWNVSSMSGRVSHALADSIGADCVALTTMGGSFGLSRAKTRQWVTPQGQEVLAPSDLQVAPDGSGGWYVFPQGDTSVLPSGHMPKGTLYFDSIERPVDYDEDALNPEDNLEEYTLLGDEDIAYTADQAKLVTATGRAVVLGMPGAGFGDIGAITGSGLKHPKGIRLIKDWYMAPLLFPEYVQEIYSRQSDIIIENLKKINQACGQLIDVIHTCGNDFGHQSGQFISLDLFRELYQPYYRKVNDWIHSNTKWKIFKHSCGAIRPLIPGFIDSGFDIINPVQTSAQGMDPAELKMEFGRDITFWGGGVDTQKVLPFGTPEEVRHQVLQRCEILSRDGGFVFGSIHTIQHGVPVANVVAMIDALHEFNGEK